MAAQIPNDSSIAFKPMLGLGSRGVVQCVHDGSNDAFLWGSVNGVDYAIVDLLTSSSITEIVLCPYFKLSTSSSSVTGTVGGNTKVYIDETR